MIGIIYLAARRYALSERGGRSGGTAPVPPSKEYTPLTQNGGRDDRFPHSSSVRCRRREVAHGLPIVTIVTIVTIAALATLPVDLVKRRLESTHSEFRYCKLVTTGAARDPDSRIISVQQLLAQVI